MTQLAGDTFELNCDLIEAIESIPETKVTLTTGKYYLVAESRKEIVEKIIAYRRMIFQDLNFLPKKKSDSDPEPEE